MRKPMLLIAATALSACVLGARTELDRNQNKWKAANITSYRFSLFVGCFCGSTDRMPLSVEVQDGRAVSITYANGEAVAADDPQLEFFSRLSTVDRLFVELRSGPASKADKVTVTYDPEYGYPAQIQVDQIKDAVDDEYGVKIKDFEALK